MPKSIKKNTGPARRVSARTNFVTAEYLSFLENESGTWTSIVIGSIDPTVQDARAAVKRHRESFPGEVQFKYRIRRVTMIRDVFEA